MGEKKIMRNGLILEQTVYHQVKFYKEELPKKLKWGAILRNGYDPCISDTYTPTGIEIIL